jgi:multicomponent Na+:H+ antiporter subunit E
MWTLKDILRLAKRFAILFGLWLVLSAADPAGLGFGLAAAAAATWLSRRLAPPADRPLRLLRLLALAPGFLRGSIAGGVDVAWRALHPRLPLRPGWIAYRPRVPEGVARVVLGSELSLLPGTLAAGSEAGCLLVHCLNVEMPVVRAIRDEEERLERAVAP